MTSAIPNHIITSNGRAIVDVSAPFETFATFAEGGFKVLTADIKSPIEHSERLALLRLADTEEPSPQRDAEHRDRLAKMTADELATVDRAVIERVRPLKHAFEQVRLHDENAKRVAELERQRQERDEKRTNLEAAKASLAPALEDARILGATLERLLSGWDSLPRAEHGTDRALSRIRAQLESARAAITGLRSNLEATEQRYASAIAVLTQEA
jgi:hypothetical protein